MLHMPTEIKPVGYNEHMKCIVCNQKGYMNNDLKSHGPYCGAHYEMLKTAEHNSAKKVVREDGWLQSPTKLAQEYILTDVETKPTKERKLVHKPKSQQKQRRTARLEVMKMVEQGDLLKHRCWGCGIEREHTRPWHDDPTQVTKVKWYCSDCHPEWDL